MGIAPSEGGGSRWARIVSRC